MINIGIIGTGKMADRMVDTLSKIPEVKCYAVVSRTQKKADKFSEKWGICQAYDSYESMLKDSNINLIYVATPHSEHYKAMKEIIEKGKPVLCEKAFTINYLQAYDIVTLSEKKGVFVSEAMWMRCLPIYKTLKEFISQGIIGKIHYITVNICYPVSHVIRMLKPSLGGGTLLDIGIYALNFVAMFFEDEPNIISGKATLTTRGVDCQENISLMWEDGRMAALQASMMVWGDNIAQISGDKGYIIIKDFINPNSFEVFDEKHNKKEYFRPHQITGYEYEIESSIDNILKGKIECSDMTHKETLRIMRWMDILRKQFKVTYPIENIT